MPFETSSSKSESNTPKAIIFDWDDTICPSTFVDSYKVEAFVDFPMDVQRILHEVARSAERCLNEASKYGEVLIITNSDEGWVKYSAERYCPKLLPVIEKYKIISARTRYERFYPGQPLCWKAAAFAHEVNELYERSQSLKGYAFNKSERSLESTDVSSESDNDDSSSSSDSSTENNSNNNNNNKSSTPKSVPPTKEIISFGDSMEERTAVRIVAEQLGAMPKSVMFVQSPTPTQIIGQLELLVGHMKYVCHQKDNLDLEISSQQADRSAEHTLKRMRPILGQEDVKMMIHRNNNQEEEAVIAAASL